MKSNALGLLLLIATAPFGWLACNLLFGIDEPTLAQPKVSDTGTAPTDAGCVPARWPAAPTTEDGTEEKTFDVAVRRIDLDVDPPAPPTGFDLDGVCTCPGPSACVRRFGALDAGDGGVHCDDPGGRDITLNRDVFKVITQSPGFSPELLNSKLESGRYGIIAEVSGYNGGKNDRTVQVAVYMSSGVSGDAGPAWDGGDPWDLDPTSVKSGDAMPYVPAFVDTTAYVTDGVLVASKLAGMKLTLGVGSGSIELDLGQAIFTAQVVPMGSSYALREGTIAGRWTVANILRAIAPLSAPVLPGGPPLCSATARPVYNYAKTTICGAADLSQNADRDLDRGADCDALSFGMRFFAEPATKGGLRAPMRYDAGCGAWTDDCTK